MLVCSKCGTAIAVAGHPCPACGHRGAIDRRFYHGAAPAPAEAVPAAPADLPTHGQSEAGTLPDTQHAWSPWLAAVTGLIFGPAAGALVAARNLQRLGVPRDPYLPAALVLVAQLLMTVVAGLIARSNLGLASALLLVFGVALLAGLVRWQWSPVAAYRAQHPGRHVPGPDAFGVFLAALLLGVATSSVTWVLIDRLSHGALAERWAEARPEPSAPAQHEMVLPPMQ